MKAIGRYLVAAMLAFTLFTPDTLRADHGSSSSHNGGAIRRPRAICGGWGCYVFPKKGRRWRSFSLNLSIRYGGYGYGYGAYGYGGDNGYYGYGD